MSVPLWYPSAARIADARLTAFLDHVRQAGRPEIRDYAALHHWSITEPADFWREVWHQCGVIGDGPGEPALADPGKMPGARFFPAARLNFAENLLRNTGPDDALVFWGEDRVTRRLSHDELNRQTSRLARALAERGIRPGDRVAGFLPNVPETVVAMLATASLGAVWSSCSPDFGRAGVVDRFGQIGPTILFCADGYQYNGRVHDSLGRVASFLGDLPTVRHVIVAGLLEDRPAIDGLPDALHLADLVAASPHEPEAAFERYPFNHPLYIMFSSGTTGRPKCIVHGAGGTLLKHLSEHQLHSDVRPGDRMFHFTTCGWMMWNWLVSGLASRATILLYDGSPFAGDPDILFDLLQAERATLFGTSAKYLDALRRTGASPAASHDLTPLRTITSTGSPLQPETFDYVYTHVKRDVCLSSIAGGTDLIGCFVAGNPIGPVWRGEIQAKCLGMAVEVFDEEGRPVRQQKGELVCTKAFPSMPLSFWDDPGDEKYRAAYFERFPGVWHHGDFAEITRHDGMIIYGRSDATLNPAGVRIGTAELYRQVEKLDEVEEALAIGQEWQGDVRIVLFVRLREGVALDEALEKRLRQEIRHGCSPRHVPARIVAVTAIPRTRSGKIVELAVRDTVHGRPVRNREALANPEALDLYVDLPELQR